MPGRSYRTFTAVPKSPSIETLCRNNCALSVSRNHIFNACLELDKLRLLWIGIALRVNVPFLDSYKTKKHIKCAYRQCRWPGKARLQLIIRRNNFDLRKKKISDFMERGYLFLKDKQIIIALVPQNVYSLQYNYLFLSFKYISWGYDFR